MVKGMLFSYEFHFRLVPMFFVILIFSFLLLPSGGYAANITTTTVTTRVKIDDFATTTEQYFKNTVKINVRKDNYSYDLDYKNKDGEYAIFQKTISRCNSTNVDSAGWQVGVSPVAARAGQVLVFGNQNICGNPTFTWDYKFVGADWSRSGGTACGTCTVSTPNTLPVQGPALTMTGVLTSARDSNRNVYYIDPSSGDNLIIGTNLGSATWDPVGEHVVGNTYSCNYFEPRSNPTEVVCKNGTVPPANRGGTTPSTPATTPSSSGTATEPPGEMTVGLNADINGSGLDDTKCPADATINKNGELSYTKGVLAGVSCVRATKTLEDVLLIVKNIVTTLLLPIVGILFLIMMMIGGILYITSAGNQQRADRGKKILTAAIVGLLIVTLSYTLIAIFTNIIGGGIS